MTIKSEYHVLLNEKELAEWFENKREKRELVPSLVFRDAVRELKQQEERRNSEDPVALSETIKSQKALIINILQFVDNEKLNEKLSKWRDKNPVEIKMSEIVSEGGNSIK